MQGYELGLFIGIVLGPVVRSTGRGHGGSAGLKCPLTLASGASSLVGCTTTCWASNCNGGMANDQCEAAARERETLSGSLPPPPSSYGRKKT